VINRAGQERSSNLVRRSSRSTVFETTPTLAGRVEGLPTDGAEEFGLRREPLRTRLLLTMKRRVRVFAALLALITLSVTSVETGWALGCDRMVAGSAADHSTHSGQPAGRDHSGSSEPSHSSAPACQAGAAVSCAPVFLPVPPIAAEAAPANTVVVRPGPETTPDLLPISPLLRPPRR
jgi:hypothetical protein